MNETSYDLKPARKAFSRIGLALCAILVIASLLQVLWFSIPQLIWGEDNWLSSSSWGNWLGSFLPLYLVAFPVGVAIMRKLPAQTPQDNKLNTKSILAWLAMCYCVMYAGNLVGTILSLLLSGGNADNAVLDYAMDTNPLKILFMVILAPLMEEFLCRKQIIDRTRQYGEKTAVLFSALIFGLLHQNLFQFFYAFGLGLILGYIYIRTGRLRYTVLLHSIINFMGAVIAPWIMTVIDLEALSNIDPNATAEELAALFGPMIPGMIIYMLYSQFLLGLVITGLVLLIIKCRKLVWLEEENQLPQGTAGKTAYWNVGMVLYILLCAAGFVLALL